MAAPRFSDEELYVLVSVVEDISPFSELVWLGTEERRPKEAAEVLLRFLRAGYIEIYEAREDRQDTVLSDEEAKAAILDEANWRDPLKDELSRWFAAVATEAGQNAYWDVNADRLGLP